MTLHWCISVFISYLFLRAGRVFISNKKWHYSVITWSVFGVYFRNKSSSSDRLGDKRHEVLRVKLIHFISFERRVQNCFAATRNATYKKCAGCVKLNYTIINLDVGSGRVALLSLFDNLLISKPVLVIRPKMEEVLPKFSYLDVNVSVYKII